MKINIVIWILSSLFCCKSCFQLDTSYEWYCYNQSNDTLGVYLASGLQTAYPDTTLPVDFNKANIGGVLPYKKQEIYRGVEYDKMITGLPKDTLSVFIISGDTIMKYRWEEIRQGYKILRRYDLSLQDIYSLYENHSPVIPYPPDERMKNMKMYPPYGSN